MATWKKVIVSGSDISQLNNDSQYLVSGDSGIELSGSFSGSFNGVLVNGTTATTQALGDNSTKVATTAYVDAVATSADLNITGSGGTTTDIDLDDQALTFTGNDGLQLSASAQTITATIADGGIVNAKLENDSVTIGSTEITLGAEPTTTVDGLTLTGATASGSFSGSFEGDGSGLTGVDASSLTNALTVGTGLGFATGTDFDGSAAREINLDLTEVISTDGVNRILTSDGDGTLTAEPNFTFDGATNLLTVTGDALVTGDLTVQGTASFQNTENLLVSDRFVLFASGSTTTGDGGIVVQQATQDVGELFGYDSGTTRWAVDSAFDASTSAFTPEAFMAAVVEGTDDIPGNAPARYQAKGNIFIGNTEGEIWIYG